MLKLGRSPYFLLQLIVVGKKFRGLMCPSRTKSIQNGNRRKSTTTSGAGGMIGWPLEGAGAISAGDH